MNNQEDLVKIPRQVLVDLLEVSPFMENTWSDFETSEKWHKVLASIEEVLTGEKKVVDVVGNIFAKARARRDEEMRLEKTFDRERNDE